MSAEPAHTGRSKVEPWGGGHRAEMILGHPYHVTLQVIESNKITSPIQNFSNVLSMNRITAGVRIDLACNMIRPAWCVGSQGRKHWLLPEGIELAHWKTV
jgi:hypothetical protein